MDPDGPSRMVKRPTGSGGEPSSPNCGASAGVKARQLTFIRAISRTFSATSLANKPFFAVTSAKNQSQHRRIVCHIEHDVAGKTAAQQVKAFSPKVPLHGGYCHQYLAVRRYCRHHRFESGSTKNQAMRRRSAGKGKDLTLAAVTS